MRWRPPLSHQWQSDDYPMKKIRPLLQPGEPEAVEVINPEGRSHVLLVCDHASNRLPQSLAGLGLDPQQLTEHIAWDPGAADVARALADRLDAPLVLSGYSRLAVDCNRPLQSSESIIEHTAGIAVPGNQQLSQEARAQRINALFHPYHRTIEQLLDKRRQSTRRLISIHSFTPLLQDQRRPWHIGISWKRDRRLADLLITRLQQHRHICLGINQPYPISDEFDYTLPHHGDRRSLQNAMIELRQDGLTSETACLGWVDILAEAINGHPVTTQSSCPRDFLRDTSLRPQD